MLTTDGILEMSKPTRTTSSSHCTCSSRLMSDADIVYNQAKAHTYAMNHCDKLEYELVDYHYPTQNTANESTHLSSYDYTKLAAPQPQAAQVQGQATHGTSCPQAY